MWLRIIFLYSIPCYWRQWKLKGDMLHGWMILTLTKILVRIHLLYSLKCTKFGQLILRRQENYWNCSHQISARPPGIPEREFPGIVMFWIQGGNSQEFVRFQRELRGIHRSFVFCLIFVADHDVFSVLTHSTTQAYRLFLSKTFSDVLNWPNF